MKSLSISLLLSVALLAQQAPSTVQMADLLDKIYRQQDWKTDPNKASERVFYYRRLLAQPLEKPKELRARFDLAQYLLQAGNSAAAVEELDKLRAAMAQANVKPKPDFDKQITELQALASLRAGEQQNCLANHNAQSCFYPLRGGGLHTDKQGAQRAAELWSSLLRDGRGTLIDKWLLNIAWMALGGPPKDAPPDWIIPSSILSSEADIGRFTDVAPASGLNSITHSGGVVAEDFDGDGYFDLIISSSGPRDQLRYFHNNGDGTFTDQTHAAGLDGETGGLNVIHADYNNDGWPDILILRGGWWGKFGGYPCSLLRNNGPNASGQITFTDVTEQAGLLSPHPTQTAAWADYDNDGYVDLLLGHETSLDDPFPSQLFHNNGDGTFTDVTAKVGLPNLGFVKGVAWGDYNNDGRPDFYVSRKGKPNLLFRNDGPDPKNGWKFTDVTGQAGVAEPAESFATWFFDYDNDGWPDLLVAGYFIETLDDIPAFHLGLPNKAEVPRLYHNNGDGTFTDVTKEMGLNRAILSMGAGFGDLDNDGWLDCYFGNGTPDYESLLPNRMFRNDHGVRFQDITVSGGFGELQKGHAVAFADFNRDGNQDVFEVLGGAVPGDTYPNVLLANPGHDNHWLALKLVGVKSNRAAVGARIRVVTSSGRNIYRTAGFGSSFGDTPFEQHFGLGTAQSIDRIEIQWPHGARQTLTGLAVDRIYEFREGDAQASLRNIKPFVYRNSAEPATHHHPVR